MGTAARASWGNWIDLMLIIALALLLLAAVVGASLLLRRARERSQQDRALLELLPETIVSLFDHELRYEQVLGATPGIADSRLLVGKTVEELVPGPEGERLAGEYRRALAGESRAFAFTSTLSGLDYWIRVTPRIEHGEVVGGVAIAQNVNELREAERELSAETRRRRVMLDAMNEAYVATDERGVITEWNRAAELTFGYEAGEAIGRDVGELIIPERDRSDLHALFERRLPGQPASGRHDLRAERTAVHRDGHEFPVELAGTLLEINGVTTYHSLMHDISRRKRAEQELRSRAADVEALSDAVAELARSTVSQEARMAICRAAARIAGAQVAILFEPDSSGTGLRTTAAEGTDLIGTLMPFTERSGAVAAFTSRENLFVDDIRGNPAVVRSIFHRTGAISGYWVPIRHDAGENALGVIAVAWSEKREELSDRLGQVMAVISAEAAVAIERAALLDRLERMARTDDLTGLTNRRAWDLELSREIVRAEREEAPLAIAMMDLDRFKDYNDEHGHQAGDRLLKEAAGAWRGVLRETDLLARYGGEEFAVALPGCEPDAARSLVERLRAVTPGGGSCSAGLACWDGSETADDLLGRADAALYEAKQSGRDRTVVA